MFPFTEKQRTPQASDEKIIPQQPNRAAGFRIRPPCSALIVSQKQDRFILEREKFTPLDPAGSKPGAMLLQIPAVFGFLPY